MASLKERLDAAGYDVSTVNEDDLIKKLDQAGYDTSEFGKQKSSFQQFREKVGKNLSTAQAGLAEQQGLAATTSPQALAEKGYEVAKIPFEKGGEMVAERGGAAGLPPALAAGLGTAIQMAPDIASMAAIPTEGISAKLKQAPKTPSAESGLFNRAAIQRTLQEDIRNLPEAQVRELDKLESLRRTASKGIEESRMAGGYPQEPISQLPIPENVPKFADNLRTIGKWTPEQVIERLGKQGAARVRDVVQQLRESGALVSGTRASAQVDEGVKAIDAGLASVDPNFADALNKYRLVSGQIEETPSYFKGRKADLQTQIGRVKGSDEKKQLLLNALKRVGLGAATAAGFKSIF